MTVGDMLGGGVRLVRTQPKALALWGLLYLVAMAAMMAMLWPMLAEMTAFQRQAMAAAASDVPPPAGPMMGFMGGVFLMELVLVVIIVAIFAAAVRAIARGGNDRFGFLRLGMDELRLIGLIVLLWLIATGGVVVAMLAAGLASAALYAVIGETATIAMLPLALVVMLAIVWAEVRISLAGAFTVLRGRIALRAAWRATRGRFWTLLGAYLVIGLVYTVVSLALTAILFPQLFGLYAAALRPGDPQAVLVAQQAMMAQVVGPRMIVAMILGTVVNTALVGWLFGAIATAAVALDDRGAAA